MKRCNEPSQLVFAVADGGLLGRCLGLCFSTAPPLHLLGAAIRGSEVAIGYNASGDDDEGTELLSPEVGVMASECVGEGSSERGTNTVSFETDLRCCRIVVLIERQIGRHRARELWESDSSWLE